MKLITARHVDGAMLRSHTFDNSIIINTINNMFSIHNKMQSAQVFMPRVQRCDRGTNELLFISVCCVL